MTERTETMNQKTIGRKTMDELPRMKMTVLAASITLALAPQAYADSGTGQDTSIGSALNTRPINILTHGSQTDEDAVGAGYEIVAHTPTGQKYEMPKVPRAATETHSGWQYLGHIEAGLLGISGKQGAQGFMRYKDVDDGFYLNSFGLAAEKPADASYFELSGGSVAKDDQFYSAQFGRYNDWKVRAFYNETRHVFSTTFRSLHSGVGSGFLTLSPQANAAGLAPGGVIAGVSAYTIAGTQALAATALQNTPDREIGLVREKGGIRFDKSLDERWKVFASYSNEKRVGARPFAALAQATGGGAQSTELAEPINYNTHDFLGGINYADSLNAFNLSLAASLFRNNTSSLTYQNPWATAAAGGVTAANGGFALNTIDLYPDNDFYNIKGEYARMFPDFYRGRFTAVVSLSSSRQNDKLMPYTNNPNAGTVIAAVTPTTWNTSASLSKDSADAKINSTLVDLGLALSPTNDLNLKGRLRYYETRNHTEFLNCNPNATYSGAISTLTYKGCTGVWGRIAGDGTGLAILDPNAATLAPGGNQGYLSEPWDREELLYSLTADYRLGNKTSINGAYEREAIKRRNREVAKTTEDKLKFGYVNRGIMEDMGTLRLSYEHALRRGTTYDANPYDASLGGAIFAANGLAPSAGSNLATGWVGNRNTWGRKFDLADRDSGTLNVRYNHIFRPDLDGGVSLQVKRQDYPDSRYGRVGKEKQDSINFDLNYQASGATNVYGFYSYQNASQKQRGTAANNAGGGLVACTGANGYSLALLGTGLAGDPLLCANPALGAASQWNPANNWEVEHRDKNHTAGFGFVHNFGKLVVDMNYVYSEGKTKISYRGIGTSAALAANGNGAFPDMKVSSNLLQANLLYPVSKEITARLLYTYEIGKIDDWHYAGDLQGNLGVTSIIVDGGPQRYKTHLLGLMFNVNF